MEELDLMKLFVQYVKSLVSHRKLFGVVLIVFLSGIVFYRFYNGDYARQYYAEAVIQAGKNDGTVIITDLELNWLINLGVFESEEIRGSIEIKSYSASNVLGIKVKAIKASDSLNTLQYYLGTIMNYLKSKYEQKEMYFNNYSMNIKKQIDALRKDIQYLKKIKDNFPESSHDISILNVVMNSININLDKYYNMSESINRRVLEHQSKSNPPEIIVSETEPKLETLESSMFVKDSAAVIILSFIFISLFIFTEIVIKKVKEEKN